MTMNQDTNFNQRRLPATVLSGFLGVGKVLITGKAGGWR